MTAITDDVTITTSTTTTTVTATIMTQKLLLESSLGDPGCEGREGREEGERERGE